MGDAKVMIEKIKAVNNPLTIIAIFAALAEIAGTVALKLVADNLQTTFIWFVMLFPALLVLFFFLTLNFNPKVLYAPSDFKDEENFLNAIGGVNRLSLNLDEIEKQLESAKSQIIDDAIRQIGVAGENERSRLTEIVNSRIGHVQEKVETTRETVEDVAFNASPNSYATYGVREKVLDLLTNANRPLSTQEIVRGLSADGRFPSISISKAMHTLTRSGLIEREVNKYGPSTYKLSGAGPTQE